MTIFNYKARDNKGNIKSGTVEAISREQVFELLKKYHLLATSISKKKKYSFSFDFLSSLKKVSLKQKVIFSRQLATMIDAGLSITKALRILQIQEKEKNKKFSEIIGSVTAEVEGGSTFSSALNKFPKVFPSIYVSLVKSGEASGKLDQSLDRVATQMEKSYDLKSKIKGAMMYPAFITVSMVVVAGIVVTFVMPQLKSLFEESSTELPIITKVLLSTSDFVRNYWWIVIFLPVGFVALFRYLLNTKKGRRLWDKLKLKIPIINIFIRDVYMAQFTRTLGTLISSCLPILDALRIVSDTMGNVHYKEEFREIARKVENGVSLAIPLEDSDLFPTMVSHMIEVGEKTGSVDKILFKLADFFDNEVSNTIAVLSTMLEPVILVIMGIGVGFMVGAVILPIYKLATAM